MTHQIQSVTLPGGPRLPYVEHGDPAGVPVVLLHGYSDSWRSWELLLPELPDTLHAFAVTQRGHGDADRPAAGYRPEDHGADVAAFMDAVGLRRGRHRRALRRQLQRPALRPRPPRPDYRPRADRRLPGLR